MQATRLVVAAIVLPLLYLYVVKLDQGYFYLLLLLASSIAQVEFYAMYRVRGLLRIAGISGGIAVLSAMYFSRGMVPDVLLSAFLVIAVVRLMGKRDPSSSLRDMAPVVTSMLYIPCSLGFQIFLRGGGPGWILFLFGCVWASDSFAYYVGRTLGRKKLFVEVSPHKTVAGAFGSVAGGALAGFLLNRAVVQTMNSGESLLIGIVIGATTILGDLVESMFKRDTGVKDSGGFIPGHGGILDKIDGVLFAGPVLYWVSRAFGLIV
jgi:phosphatidate cytidylyltransferase